jgi:hypothetical protein
MTPILQPGFSPAQKAVACRSLHELAYRGAFDRELTALGQYLELNESARVPAGFEKVIQSIIIASTDFPDHGKFPLLDFASRLSSATIDADFDRFMVAVQWGQKPPTRLTTILWNSWASLAGGNLSVRDLTGIPGTPPQMFLLKLPAKYSDLFTNEFYGAEFSIASRDHMEDFCCCLNCGALLMVTTLLDVVMLRRLLACEGALVMMLTDAHSTLVVTLDVKESRCTKFPPLCLTEEGAESIGLTLELPLVLSESRRRSLVSEMLVGEHIF